jgi:ABC-type multidrug transport system fused ATPase/permease subunit
MAMLAAYGIYAIIIKATGAAPLNPTTLFTSLAIIQVATNPLLTLIQGIPRLASSVACLTRIQSLLQLPECSARTVTRDVASRFQSSSVNQEQNVDIVELSSGISHKNVFEASPEARKSCIMRVKLASFSWVASDSVGVLKNISFEIYRSSLIAIVGP